MSLQRIFVSLALMMFGALAASAWHSLAHHGETGEISAGPVDVGFAQSMSSHHDQAIVMTQILLDRGSTRLATLAKSIQTGQLIETGKMNGWLLLWGKPLLPATSAMNWMLLGKSPPDATLSRYIAECQTIPGGMPGLATSEDLNRLRALDGEDRDRLFLELMTRHHKAALPMARFARLNAETPTVRTIAAQIEMEQSQEIVAMALMANGH